MAAKKNKSKKSFAFYFLGTILMLLILGIAVYHNSANDLTQTVDNYIYKKQTVRDAVGDVKSVRYLSMPWTLDRSRPQSLSAQITGTRDTAILNFSATHTAEGWRLSRLRLKSRSGTTQLSPVFVDQALFFAASDSSAPLKEPVFLSGEDIFIKVLLKGLPPAPVNTQITEAMTVLDRDNIIVASNPRAAQIKQPPTGMQKDSVWITNKISPLDAGTYRAEFEFIEASLKNKGVSEKIEVFTKSFSVKKTATTLFVKSVRYFKDELKKQPTVPEFEQNQNIYVRLILDGFKVKEKKIAGSVDLKITNVKGDVVAFKPKFASFNQLYDPDKNIVVDGVVNLKEPDIYFLSFRISDFLTDQNITHDEKVLVRLSKPEPKQTP